MTPTIVVSSTSNRAGIEVHLERVDVAQTLCAYRNGRLSARLQVGRSHGRRVDAGDVEILEERPGQELRALLLAALEEGLRVTRDGRGLCEAA